MAQIRQIQNPAPYLRLSPANKWTYYEQHVMANDFVLKSKKKKKSNNKDEPVWSR